MLTADWGRFLQPAQKRQYIFYTAHYCIAGIYMVIYMWKWKYLPNNVRKGGDTNGFIFITEYKRDL